MSPTIGMFNTPRVIRSVVLIALGPDQHNYVLVGMAGATSAWSLRLVMALASAEACFQPNVFTYFDSCSIVSLNCTTSLAIPDVKNTSSYSLVGTRNALFVIVGALFAGPNFFQGFFTFFVILHTLDFIGIMLIEHYPCLSTLLVD